MYLLVFFVFIVHANVYVHFHVTFSRFASCTSVFRVAVAVRRRVPGNSDKANLYK